MYIPHLGVVEIPKIDRSIRMQNKERHFPHNSDAAAVFNAKQCCQHKGQKKQMRPFLHQRIIKQE